MKKTAVLILFLLAFPALSHAALPHSGEEIFFRANQAFREARYSEAAHDYESLIEKGHAGGHLYYNLANACFKMNRLGAAILNYERAKIFMPRDADLAFNLSYAQDRKTDAVAPHAQAVSSVFFWLNSLSLAELFRVFIAFHVALFAVLLLRLRVRNDLTYYLLTALLFFWFGSGVSLSLKYYEIFSDNRGVVIAKQADVLAGPQAGDTLLFRLHEGTTIVQERFEPDWRLISLPDGKRGWIRESEVQSIMDRRLKPRLMPFP